MPHLEQLSDQNTGKERIVKYRLTNFEFNLQDFLNSGKNLGKNCDKKLQKKLFLTNSINTNIDIKINTAFSFRENVLTKKEFEEDIISTYRLPREFGNGESDVNIFPSIYLLSDLISKNGFLVNDESLKMFSNENTEVN